MQRRLFARPLRAHAEAEEADAERARDLAQLREMRGQFARALMDGLQRRAGELELAARLERDRAAAGHVGKADDVRPVHDRLPAEQMLHADEQRADRAAAFVGDRLVRVGRERELLVLGPGPPLRLRFRAFGEPRDELVARFDRRQVDNVTGHLRNCPEGEGARPYTRRRQEQRRRDLGMSHSVL